MGFEPTCWALCCRGAGCLRGVGTYVLGTVLQGCRLFKRCWNLPGGHCMCCRDAGCLKGVRTYLLGTVLQVCRLFKLCRNLPVRHCVAGVQAV